MPRGQYERRDNDAAMRPLGGVEPEREIAEMGDPELVIVDGPVIKDALEMERFMAEPVKVRLAESTDKNDYDVVPVWINGRLQNFRRGENVTVKRCYVEKLARTKMTTYTQDLDPGQGERMNKVQPHTALQYPFMVVEDKNPNGSAWLDKILNER